MSPSPADLDAQRRRWLRARGRLQMVDATHAGLALADLGARIADLRVRVLVLPGDPDGACPKFNDDFWKWWRSNPPPHSGGTAPWRTDVGASAWAALRYHAPREEAWDAYLGLRRE